MTRRSLIDRATGSRHLPAPLPPMRATGLQHLPPEMAKWTPPLTKMARALRNTGVIREEGVISGFEDGAGQGQTTIKLTFPGLAEGVASGGGTLSIPFDLEAARYLPPRTRVRLTLEIIGVTEDEDG